MYIYIYTVYSDDNYALGVRYIFLINGLDYKLCSDENYSSGNISKQPNN